MAPPPEPADPEPADPEPDQPAPAAPPSGEPALGQPEPDQPEPAEPPRTKPVPVEPEPVEPVPVEPVPVEPVPVASESVELEPVAPEPVELAPPAEVAVVAPEPVELAPPIEPGLAAPEPVEAAPADPGSARPVAAPAPERPEPAPTADHGGDFQAVSPSARAGWERDTPFRAPPANRGARIRRRRLMTRVLGLVALAGLGVTAGGVISTRNRSSASPPAAGESEPSVTTPATVVSGRPSDAVSQVSARIQQENARPGSTGWKITDGAGDHEIEGFADQTSVIVGQPVTLYVSTSAPGFHVEVYRMGYYQGLGGRLVQTSSEVPGQLQAPPHFAPGINMVEAQWTPSLVLATGSWPEGDYLLKLVASTGKQRYVPLTVRAPASTSAFVVLNAVTTWEAYNLWGGYDLYQGLNRSGSDYGHRSRVVSFDRPYLLGDGAGDFLGLEYPLVSLMESLGLDVTYMTDIDLQQQSNPLLTHKAVISPGHDEYYSLLMRQALEQARDHGVNLAFLGANAIFRHIRFDFSPLGPNRREIDYKSAVEDPFNGRDDADVTVDWRLAPNNNPESQIIGDFYQCNPVRADMVVVDPENWLFQGSGAVAGQKLHNVVGTEYDRYDPTVAGPPNVEILTHSPLRCAGKADYADATYYTAPSGAGVFAAGTIDWVGNMDTHCQPADCPGRVLGRVTENLLSAFGMGPAGVAHPSEPGQSTVPTHPPTPAPTSTTATGLRSPAR